MVQYRLKPARADIAHELSTAERRSDEDKRPQARIERQPLTAMQSMENVGREPAFCDPRSARESGPTPY